ncbi:glutamate synthetase [Legionella busanensis]|uniref:Glutamate synthetase n=1 Tax=Legionella busanensis TaxID=190655 RepID=A0A378JJ59_9GAMM|nr:CDGSH iron-sulfur domain-containing protein [Legionella busanensis]STX51194.1 glutamate synthetase [Legionella busanensis]
MEDDLSNYLPMAVEVEGGKTYRWCSCGKSQTQPLCDRADCNLGVEYYASYTDVVYFCACKQTKDPPFCDGSHAKLLLKLLNERKKQDKRSPT